MTVQQPSSPVGELMGATGIGRPRLFALLVVVYCALGFGAVGWATLAFPLFQAIRLPFAPLGIDPAVAGLGVWIAICLATSTQGTHDTGQVPLAFSTGPVMAAALLGGPTAAAWVALIGTIAVRDLRGGGPWYGVLAKQGMRALSAMVAALALLLVRMLDINPLQLRDLIAILAGTVTMVVMEEGLGLLLWHARSGRPVSEGFGVVSRADWNLSAIAEACLAWLVVLAYFSGLWWAPVLIIVADLAASRSMAHHQATWQLRHHPLTNLPNGRALRDHVDDLRRAGSPSSMCLVYIDLDGFKAVNDDHGHDVGDDVLREVGRRLGAIAGPDVFVAHLHGDEFIVLAARIGDDQAADELAGRLCGLVEPPITHEAGQLSVSATAGTHLMRDLANFDGSMRAADQEMLGMKAERARSGGRDRRRS